MDSEKKSGAIIVATAIIIAVLLWKAAVPLTNESNNLGQEISEQQKQISVFASYTKYMAELKASYKKNEERIKKADATIVTDSEFDKLEFLKEIEIISDKTANSLETNLLKEQETRKAVQKSSADKKPAEPLSFFSNMVLSLRVRGALPNLLNFLAEIENMPYYANIDSIFISSIADEKIPEATIDSNVKLKVFTKAKE